METIAPITGPCQNQNISSLPGEMIPYERVMKLRMPKRIPDTMRPIPRSLSARIGVAGAVLRINALTPFDYALPEAALSKWVRGNYPGVRGHRGGDGLGPAAVRFHRWKAVRTPRHLLRGLTEPTDDEGEAEEHEP